MFLCVMLTEMTLETVSSWQNMHRRLFIRQTGASHKTNHKTTPTIIIYTMSSKSTVYSNKMAPAVIVVQVPTKTHDGGRKGSMKPVNNKQDDPFMYYSNQETRMNAMLLKDSDVPAATATNNNKKVVRKTRISFEIHPSLLFDDIIFGSDLEDQDDDGYFDIIQALFDDDAKRAETPRQ